MSQHTGTPETSLLTLLKSSTVTLAVLIAGIIMIIAACSKDAPAESNQVALEAGQSSGDSLWIQPALWFSPSAPT